MNVQQAFERLKSARAYCGKNIYGRVPFFSNERHVLDASYKDAVDTLDESYRAWNQNWRPVLEGQKNTIANLHETVEQQHRQNQVSHDFRARADKKWDGSYTKRVVDRLSRYFPNTFKSPETAWPGGHALKDAAELLADYHHTMHTIYAQRDEARDLAEKRLQANVAIVQKLRNLGGLTNTHIVASEYEPLVRDIRSMKSGDTLGHQPAKMLLAKIDENALLLDRVKRAEEGEIEAVKSRDVTRDKLTLVQNGYRYMKSQVNEISVELANARKRADSLAAQLDLAQQTLRQTQINYPRPSENLPRSPSPFALDIETHTRNFLYTPPRKAVHGDIFPHIVLQDVRLYYNSLRAPPWTTPRTLINDVAVESAKRTLTTALSSLQNESFDSTPGIAANHIEKLIDAKWDARRYQK